MHAYLAAARKHDHIGDLILTVNDDELPAAKARHNFGEGQK